MTQCEERERLSKAAMDTLRQIVTVTQQLIEANQLNDLMEIRRLDPQLEQLVGAKERAFGALAQHKNDHGC